MDYPKLGGAGDFRPDSFVKQEHGEEAEGKKGREENQSMAKHYGFCGKAE